MYIKLSRTRKIARKTAKMLKSALKYGFKSRVHLWHAHDIQDIINGSYMHNVAFRQLKLKRKRFFE